jgi:hypothetical protein
MTFTTDPPTQSCGATSCTDNADILECGAAATLFYCPRITRNDAKISDTEKSILFPSGVSLASRLPISRTHIDHHHTLHRVIQPIGNGVVPDNFDLPNLERGIFIAVVAFGPRPVPQAVDELYDLVPLTATSWHRFEQVDV